MRKLTIEIEREDTGATNIRTVKDGKTIYESGFDVLDIVLGKMDMLISDFVLTNDPNDDEIKLVKETRIGGKK